MTKVYEPHHLRFLELGYPLMGVADLTRVFNKKFRMYRSQEQIRATLTRNKITCGRKTGALNRGKLRIFTRDQDLYLREAYKSKTLVEIAEDMNAHFGLSLTADQLKSYCGNHKIHSGRTGCFEKGHRSWNAGTKGAGLTGPNSGSFKKGSVPPNRKPLGSERIDTKDGYIYIKVAETDPYTGFPTRYKLKHHHVWEQYYGPIPDGKIVTFIDGNKLNCAIDNLEMITLAENAVLNKLGVRYAPDDMRPAVKNLVKLTMRARELKKESRK